jgi:catechol 2,3-dioxygenase-like lactoylglutathione lyase family enzyme
LAGPADRDDLDPRHRLHAGERDRLLPRRGLGLVQSVERARLFVRMALREAPGLGKGHGPLGQQAVRLDTGLGLRLNQVTVTGKDYAKMVDFYRRLGLKQIVDSPRIQYARFEAGAATFSIQCDPKPRSVKPSPSISNATTSTSGSSGWPIRHSVRTWSAQPAVGLARGAAPRSVWQHRIFLSRRRSAPLSAVADGRVIHRNFRDLVAILWRAR